LYSLLASTISRRISGVTVRALNAPSIGQPSGRERAGWSGRLATAAVFFEPH
jgi:hypothetical protein